MSAVCDIALAVGLTLGGLCQAEPATDQALPPDDETAWDFQAPPPPEPPPPKVDPPPPPPAPEFPPVVIVKEAPPPLPTPEPAPEPAPRVEPPPPDPYRIALASVLSARPGNDATLRHVAAAPASHEAVDFPKTDAPDSLSPPSDASARQEPRYASEFRESGEPVDNARIVAADRYISGIVETGINSQLSGDSGQVVIQTSRPVFGYHGRNVLIPKGSRLICDYEGPEELGQTRVAIECKRILMGGHRAEIVQLAAGVGDVQGRLGATGDVDTRFWERYGTAFVLAGISASVRLASATVATSGDETEGAIGQIADQGSQELSERLGEITAAVLENAVDLEPIVTIPQGTRITIRPAFDWYLKQANGE